MHPRRPHRPSKQHQSLTVDFFVFQGNPRTTAILAVAKANGLDLDLVHTEPAKGVSTEYLKLNKLGKIPTFEGEDGYVLTEAMAIAIYSEYITALLHPSQ